MDIILLTGLLLVIFSVRTQACNCSSSCLPSPGNKTYPCNPFTQECLYGCKNGFSGVDCSIVCPGNCKEPATLGEETCNETTSECLRGCKNGFFGPLCSKECSKINGLCASCHEGSDSAVSCTDCIKHFYLNNGVCRSCSYWCSEGYTDKSVCDLHTGQCLYGCKYGRYGRYCDSPCSNTCNGNVCDQMTGTCTNGCNPSAYCGLTCQITCNERCSRSCYQNCSCDYDCTVSTWGQHCEHMCSPNCQKPADVSAPICDSRNGSCIHGCVSHTSWGSDCTNLCSCHCKNATCQQETGYCTGGCESGWHGDKCSFKA